MATFRLFTLGCKVNQYETQYLEEALCHNDYTRVSAGKADLYVVNTCAVTHEAEAKARRLIRRLSRENPKLGVLVTGCYASRAREALANLGPNIRVIADKRSLPEYLAQYGVRRWPEGISRFEGRQRAFIKVQDGCLLNCTFCVIPIVRPHFVSRPIDAIVAEVQRLINNGYKEVVLTGIHLGHYGIDLSRGKPKSQWSRLWHLVDRIGELPGEFRIRLSSLEAAEVRGDLLAACQRNKRVCPHFHICLQSGSDRILQAMRRRYRVKSLIAHCQALRAVFDNPAISTDIIVGFPGETEEDFQATLEVAEQVGFAWIHIFPFSPREGTIAAQMVNQVPSHIMRERKHRLAELDRRLRQRYLQSLVGKRLQVLVEKADTELPGHVCGTACRGVRVSLPGRREWIGQLIPVRVIAVRNLHLVGYADYSWKSQSAPHANLMADTEEFPTYLKPKNTKLSLPMLGA